MHRIVIKCAEDSARSRAVPVRLGFRLESTIRDLQSPISPGR
jgi:RimJ/RimL family protein N-acetyltransferase